MTHDEMIAVITHHKNGGKVEFSRKGGMATGAPREWEYTAKPTFNFKDFDYRAKPDPLVLWGVFFANGAFATASSTEDGAKEAAKSIGVMMKIKKFAEVTE